ncbi:hypothetical protein TEA_030194 [Camellia sinensis var. sinensis]|uniref:Uncharacterized protein n=1 Tax=Camellia sinensis var. sinensis TaxID=542762 RepID=A0A4S4E5F4_CAMSN|nr:hypothetical protein TEA_030194 [Camellia sinensis var. sinensis]
MWHLWKEQNKRTFKGEEVPLHWLKSCFLAILCSWVSGSTFWNHLLFDAGFIIYDLHVCIYFLMLATPILTAPLEEETSLTDILVRKPSSSSASVNLMVLLELFSMYRDWQEAKIQTISKKQEEVENKIEVADALTVKLLQRFNYSVSTMKTTSHHLSEVHALQVDLGELKGRLTEVISNCDSLCKRINAEGPESLRSSRITTHVAYEPNRTQITLIEVVSSFFTSQLTSTATLELDFVCDYDYDCDCDTGAGLRLRHWASTSASQMDKTLIAAFESVRENFQKEIGVLYK